MGSIMNRIYLSALILTSTTLARQVILDLEEAQSTHQCPETHAGINVAVVSMAESNTNIDHAECEGPSYIDPKNGDNSCCPVNTFWRTDKDYPSEGECCPRGKGYSFDISVQKGECCGPGQLFVGSACRSTDRSVKYLDTSTQGPCPSCGNGNVCSYYGNLGLRYNHCYTMTDTGGNEIRQSAGYYINQDTTYSGERGIPFRICASSTNCTIQKDQYVPEGGYWFQLDEQGPSSNPNGQPGWVTYQTGTQWLVVASILPPPTSSSIANFTGNGTCMFGECAICIKFGAPGGNGGYQGLGSLAGGVGSAPLTVANSRNCRPWHYEETNCIGPSSVAPN